MAQLSPKTKLRVHQINVFKKATGRSKKMVTAELMKKAEPSPSAKKKTHPKGLARSENRFSSGPPWRPLRRTIEEDHVVGSFGSTEVFPRQSDILKNGFEPAAAAANESEPINNIRSVEGLDSVRELHQRISPAKENLQQRSPARLASVIGRPTASAEESRSPRQMPNGHTKSSETDGALTDQCSSECQISEAYRVVESSVTCANCNSSSPPRVQLDHDRAGSLGANGFEDLLRKVGSPETAATSSPSSNLPAVLNGDSDPVKIRLGVQSLQRRVASPQYVSPPTYFHGLWNLGNTCYMNAVIQLLYNLECFTADFPLPIVRGIALPSDGIYIALREVFYLMARSGEHAVVIPTCLQNACEKYMTDFCGGVQQDAQEYLLNVLDKIEEEITCNQGRVWQQSLSIAVNLENICPTTRNFSCQVRRILSCEGCENFVNVEQSSRHFSLPLPEDRRDPQAEVPDMEALLNIYFQVETLSRKCEKCGAETMKSETKIVQLPRVMILHINRFEIDRHMLCSKVSIPVKFADSLDLGKWCLDKVRGPCDAQDFICNGRQEVSGDLPGLADCREISHSNGARPADSEESSKIWVRDSKTKLGTPYSSQMNELSTSISTTYKLHGVVSHVGKLASCGHYTVDIFDLESSKYIRCDDAIVREVSPEDVFSEEKCAEAYVLLYVLRQDGV